MIKSCEFHRCLAAPGSRSHWIRSEWPTISLPFVSLTATPTFEPWECTRGSPSTRISWLFHQADRIPKSSSGGGFDTVGAFWTKHIWTSRRKPWIYVFPQQIRTYRNVPWWIGHKVWSLVNSKFQSAGCFSWHRACGLPTAFSFCIEWKLDEEA